MLSTQIAAIAYILKYNRFKQFTEVMSVMVYYVITTLLSTEQDLNAVVIIT